MLDATQLHPRCFDSMANIFINVTNRRGQCGPANLWRTYMLGDVDGEVLFLFRTPARIPPIRTYSQIMLMLYLLQLFYDIFTLVDLIH
jgi:hypothetical protein